MLFRYIGSKNHGCEAIVRSTVKVLSLNSDDILLSKSINEDYHFKLDSLLTLKSIPTLNTSSFFYRLKALFSSNKDLFYYNNLYDTISDIIDNSNIALSIGGDNYCYPGYPLEMSIINDKLLNAKMKTVLWGCSVENTFLTDAVVHDLSKYNLIVARESLTHSILKKKGLSNLTYLPDTAFLLNRNEKTLPEKFSYKNTVGINISPLILSYEKQSGIVFQSYIHLIKYKIGRSHV